MAMSSKTPPLKRGDIILVPFPFTDLFGSKVRPAIIVSADPQQQDIVIAFISSVVDKPGNSDVVLENKNPDFPKTGLKKTSVFKMGKLLTVDSVLAIRHLGHAPSSLLLVLEKALRSALNL